jgi:hypothetical protein
MCMWLSLYLRSHPKKFKSFWPFLRRCHNFLRLQRKFPKIQRKIFHWTIFALIFFMEGRISFIPSPDCCIFIAVSKNTCIVQLGRHNGHMAIWPFGHYGVEWPCSRYGVKGGHYGCFRKQQYKCSNLVKESSRFDFPTSNESKNGPMEYFPLYFWEFPL